MNIPSEERTLTEIEAKQLLRQWGIDVVDARLASSREEAVAVSEQLGFPVVLKIVSRDITHKSDAGGVRLDVKNASQVAKAYEDILSSAQRVHPRASVQGVCVQKMARPGVELIIGMATDSTFGPMLMFGVGGVFVEILKDVAFRIIPLAEKDAHEMIKEVRAYPVLEGFRNHEGVDLCFLERLLLRVSGFVQENPIVKEIDMNPVIAHNNGAVVVDARIVVGEKQ